jgi:hypothetical protein
MNEDGCFASWEGFVVVNWLVARAVSKLSCVKFEEKSGGCFDQKCFGKVAAVRTLSC